MFENCSNRIGLRGSHYSKDSLLKKALKFYILLGPRNLRNQKRLRGANGYMYL